MPRSPAAPVRVSMLLSSRLVEVWVGGGVFVERREAEGGRRGGKAPGLEVRCRACRLPVGEGSQRQSAPCLDRFQSWGNLERGRWLGRARQLPGCAAWLRTQIMSLR